MNSCALTIFLMSWTWSILFATLQGSVAPSILCKEKSETTSELNNIVNVHLHSLLHQGFQYAANTSHCSRLLHPERGSLAIVFELVVCVRIEHEIDKVNTIHKVQGSPLDFISRTELFQRCAGQCTASYEHDGVTVTTFDSTRYKLSSRVPLFRKIAHNTNRYPYALIVATVVFLALFARGDRKVMWLSTVLLLFKFWTSLQSHSHQFNLSPRILPSQAITNVHGYELRNFSREVVKRGNRKCMIFTCNAYSSVVNIRHNTVCDVLNFRAISVWHGDRPVVLNWLKVLVAIWISQNETYDSIIYIDRDVILTEDPVELDGNKSLLFADLGGQKPDAAMFVSKKEPAAYNQKFFQKWLRREGGKSVRRDGGEEQETLLFLAKETRVDTGFEMYSFQCGRNAMNRAQCLLEDNYISWNQDLVAAKLVMEWVIVIAKSYTPRTLLFFPHPFLPFKDLGTLSSVQSLGTLLEAILYIQIFQSSEAQEVRCSPTAVKSISQGSFDNPYQKTLAGVSSSGVARRGKSGWNCFGMFGDTEIWSRHSLTDLQSFALAHVIVCLPAGGTVWRKLLQAKFHLK